MSRLKYVVAAGALALVAGLAVVWSVGQKAHQAEQKARAELAGERVETETVYAGDFPASAPAPVRAVTRLMPVNGTVWFEGAPAVGTDGGLVLLTSPPVVLTAAEGLAGTRVSSLARLGELLVVGTDQGVSVLGEGTLRSYAFADAPANRVRCLHADGREVWIGTEGGVLRFDGRSFTYHPAFPRHDLMVTSLARWGDAVVAGTWRNGVIAVFPDRELTAGADEGLAEPITAVVADGKRLLIGTPLGLAGWEEGAPPRLVLDNVSVSGLARDGEAVAVATWDQGLMLLEGGKARTVLDDQSLRGVDLVEGRLYAAGDSGLFTAMKDGFEPVTLPSSGPTLSENRLTALAVDESGRLWAGTFESGVDVLGPDLGLIERLAEPDFEDVNFIRAGSDGRVYVGAGRGLLIYRGTGLERTVTSREGLIGESVFDAVEMGDGTLAVATGAGVTMVEPTRSESVSAFHGLVNNHVYALGRWGDRLVAGTLGGLSWLEGTRVRESLTMGNSGLSHNWITALEPGDGGLFIGTFGGGVALLDGSGKVTSLGAPAAGLDVNNHALLWRDGRLLVGTFGGGLLVYRSDPGEWSKPPVRLTSPNVTGLAFLGDGAGGERLAAATDCGLNLLDPADLIP